MKDKDIAQTDVTGAPGNTGASNENGEVDVGMYIATRILSAIPKNSHTMKNRHLKILTHHMPCIYPG